MSSQSDTIVVLKYRPPREMSHEEHSRADNVEKQNEYVSDDSGFLEGSRSDSAGKETMKTLEINESGSVEVGKEISNESNEDEEKELAREDVCRDFLNNMCSRGSRCKFYHPPSIVRQRASQKTPEGIEYRFCIDYQNRGCHRDNCRYIHAHREDVDRYKMTGEVTLNLAREIAAVYNCDTINGIPFCKEYQTGSCSRGGQRCRYWHINVEEERERRRRVPRVPPSIVPPVARGPGLGLSYCTYLSRRSHPYGAADTFGTYNKRIRYDLDEDYVRDLERRNAELSKEVEGLKRELSRERERYGDLYTLFRQRTTIATAQHDSTNTVPAAAAYYQAASTGWTETQWTH
uniref:C3H1-type domain-containing protein n=1 Tax=Setaria digitata TaxID=48799 RepID=A0A915PY67_9BILA